MLEEEIIAIEGYHTTEKKDAIHILETEFKPRYNNKHYLGQGTYFFDDLGIASDNKKMLINSESIVIINASIEVPTSNYLDLDNKYNQNAFRKFCNEIIKDLQEKGIKIVDNDKTRKNERHMVFRCYCLDIYKKDRNFFVISKTFAKDNPNYGVKVAGFDYFGLSYFEKYVCVSNNSCVKKKRIIEEEWYV